MSLCNVSAMAVLQMIAQIGRQHERVVVRRVMRRVEQRHGTALRQIDDLRDSFIVARQFGAIAAGELRPARRIMPEPFAQGRTRRDLLEPQRQRRFLLAQAARPEPIDQHAGAVVTERGIVY